MQDTQFNEKQLEIIHDIDGPMFAVGIPGSGKTTTIAARIGFTIEEAAVEPHNILVLTFSNAAVTAMKKKLLATYGEVGYRVHVYTFHGFCSRVLKDNPDLFGVRGIEPATRLEQLEVVRSLIDKLSPSNPLLSVKNLPYFYEGLILDLFSLMKSEDWDYSEIEKACQEWVFDLPTHPDFIYKRKYKEFQKGDPKTAAIEKEKERMMLLMNAANLFNDYNEKLFEMERMDFDDMLNITVRQFEENEWFLQRYKEQYTHFIVDEAQDTNGIQFTLLELLIKDRDNKPDVLICGDEDQSIYGFQGSRMKNIADFIYKYNPKIVSLQQNYRSRPKILQAATNVIQHNTERYSTRFGFDKTIVPVKPNTLIDVKSYEYATPFQEYVGIVNYIKTDVKKGTFVGRRFEDVAIIYSKNRQAVELKRLLNSMQIPYQSSKRVNIIESQIFHHFMAIMKVAYYGTRAKNSLYQIPFFKYFPHKDELFKLLYKDIDTYYETMKLVQDKGEFRYIGNPGLDFIVELMEVVATFSLKDAAIKVFQLSGLSEFCIEDTERVQIMRKIIVYVEEFAKANPDAKFSTFNKHINTMKENNIPIDVDLVFGSERGVHLMTAHASKGLEFPHVIMMDCNEGWLPNNKGYTRFKLPPTLTHERNNADLEEARRAFYVSMTRAEEKHFCFYSILPQTTMAKKQRHVYFSRRLKLHQSRKSLELLMDSRKAI